MALAHPFFSPFPHPPRKCHYSLFPYTRALKSSGLLIGLLNKTKAKQKQIQIPIPNYDMSFYCTLPALLTSQLARLNHLGLRVMSMVCWGPCQGNVWTMLGPCLAWIEMSKWWNTTTVHVAIIGSRKCPFITT